MKGFDTLVIYEWENIYQFRKIKINVKEFKKESLKMKDWNGEFKRCCTCLENYPLNTYYFASGGNNKLHRRCKLCDGGTFGWGRVFNEKANKLGEHYCRKCDRVLPLNSLYFNRTNGKSNKNGFSSNCKQCSNNSTEFKLHSLNSNHIINDIKNGYKICHGCYYELPNNDIYFFKKSDRENGQTKCKKCLGHKYDIERPNRVFSNIINEKYRFCSICKKIKSTNEMSNYSNCRKCLKIKTKLFNNKPKQKLRIRKNIDKRRNKFKSVRCDLTAEQFKDTLLFFEHSCAYCGLSELEHFHLYKERLHFEHIIPLSKEGAFTKNNIIPACRNCNSSKSNKSMEDFFTRNSKFTETRLNKIKSFIEIYK